MEEKDIVNTTAEELSSAKPDYEKEIASIIRSNASPAQIKDKLLDYHENDIAAALDSMSISERQRLYRLLNIDELSDIFEYVDEDNIPTYFKELDIKKKDAVVSEMDADKAVFVLQHLDKKTRDDLIELIGNDARRDIALISSFDDDQIGSKMTTNFVLIHSTLTIKQAMRELVNQAAENDNISTIYVEDENDVFCGAISLNELIIARADMPLSDLIVTSYPFVYAKEDIDDCIEWIKDYSQDSIPALDENNRLLGVITAQDIVKVVDDEMSEDYAMLYEAPVATIQEKFKLNRKISCSVIAVFALIVSLCIQGIVSEWMDVLSIYICPLGAGLAGIMFFWVLGKKYVENQVNLGRTNKFTDKFYPVCKYIYCPVCILVLILGIVFGGIG